MDLLKEAFIKIKEDISSLRNDLSSIASELTLLKDSINSLKSKVENTSLKPQDLGEIPPSFTQTIQTDNPLHSDTYPDTSTDNQTDDSDNTPLEPLYTQNPPFSSGNGGVQTDRQTDRQTIRQINPGNNMSWKVPSSSIIPAITEFERANEILNSLDDVKKEIRLKFKSLTPQEMLVFSTLYTLDQEGVEGIDYTLVAGSINLTESSIRDYINKLVKKGIPIDKKRLNNKKIVLKISQNLKKIASLSTIIDLRNL